MRNIVLLFILCPVFSHSQSCNQLPAAGDFSIQVISNSVTGNAFDIDVAPDLRVYWVERLGAFRVYDPGQNQTTLIRNFSVHTSGTGWERNNEGGLQGIALDPDFTNNHWVYLYYSVPVNQLGGSVSPNQFGPIERVSRFTLTNNNTQVDMATEKVIYEHTIWAQCCHHGGDLLFGPDSNLWITTGDNNNPTYSNDNPRDASQVYRDVRATTANSNDPRGKILRIRPISFPDTQTPSPGVGTTYTIPPGNLFAPGTANTLPEIYTMGHRNPFSISVLTGNSWLAIGEASGGQGEDEINVTTGPGFLGWPYFSGDNVSYVGSFNPNSVVNNSPHNTGITNLPNAIPAAITRSSTTYNMPENCMGVVLSWITYDPYLNSSVKFPPYLDGALLATMYGRSAIYAARFNGSGVVNSLQSLFNGSSTLENIHRSIQGPDGALYIAAGEYTFNNTTNSKIVKISYNGPCSTVEPLVLKYRMSPDQLAAYRPVIPHFGITSLVFPQTAVRVELYNLNGAKVWDTERPQGMDRIHLPRSLSKGVYQARFY